MEGIEGARFHCQLCENFDMCQGCFVAQGVNHIHGQAAFTCPELDELEAMGEGDGDEGDEGDLELSEYLDMFGDDANEDPSLDAGDFYNGDDAEVSAESSGNVHLEDENGPLERITSEEEVESEEEGEDIPISQLFPKLPAASPKKSQTNFTEEPVISQKLTQNLPEQPASAKKSKKKKKLALNNHAPPQNTTQPTPTPLDRNKSHKKKKKKSSENSGIPMSQPQAKKPKQPTVNRMATLSEVDETEPLAFLSGNPSKKKLQNGSPKKRKPTSAPSPQTLPQASQAAPTKKRALAEGTASKVKKQKLMTAAQLKSE
jgi:hypothetical protein